MSVYVLLATIPARRFYCTRLLAEIANQTRRPDGIILCLDGYGDAPAPDSPLPVVATYRTAQLSGAGARWRVVKERSADGFLVEPEDILINLDDDIMLVQAPRLVQKLVEAIESGGGASAAMGVSPDKKPAPPMDFSRGKLAYAAACGLAVRAKHLAGLSELAADVLAAGGPDALGVHGDDDALVSALLHLQKVPILHAGTGNIFAAPGTQSSSQTHARLRKKEPLDAQKKAIRRITGWPWPLP